MKASILKYLPLFSLITSSTFMFAQTESSTGFKAQKSDQEQKILEKGKNYDVNFDISNHEAFFLEGEDSLFRFLYNRLTISQGAIDANLVANAMIGFKVNFDGKVQQAYSIGQVGFGIDEQLIAELNKLEFVPASQGNIPYRSEIVLEIPIKAAYLAGMKK
jgi:hypothetical protein